MHKTSSADRRWRLSLSLIVPVALAMLAVLGCVGGFVVWSAVNNDARTVQHEQTYVVDGSDNPIHAMQDGKEIKPARLAGGGKEFSPLRTFAPAFRNHRLST